MWLIVGLVAACDAATTATGEADAREIGFDVALVDFGEVVLGDTVERVVTLHNPTDAPLRISGVATSCGCTRVVDPPREAQAGRNTTIRLQFTGEGRPGVETAGALTVALASGEVLSLPIRGTAVHAIRASPEAIEAGEVSHVTLASRDGVAFRLLGVEPAGSAALSSEAATTHTLAVSLDATGSPPPAAVVFQTDHPNMPTVVVRANYQPPELPSQRAAVRPSRLTAPIDPEGVPPNVQLTVFAPAGAATTISPTIRRGGSDWRVQDASWSEDGRRCTVTLQFHNLPASPTRSEVLLDFGDYIALCRIQLTAAPVQPPSQ